MKHLIPLLLLLTLIQSATITWNYDFNANSDPEGTARNWNDAANWDPAQVPTASDDVIITQSYTTNAIPPDFYIDLPAGVQVQSLSHSARMIALRGGDLTVGDLTVNDGMFLDMEISLTGVGNIGFQFKSPMRLSGVDFTIESGAVLNTEELIFIQFGTDSLLTIDGTWNVLNGISVYGEDAFDSRLDTNCKIVNNGIWNFTGDINSRFDRIEIEQTANGLLHINIEDPEDPEQGLYFNLDTDDEPSGSENWNGAPASFDGTIRITSGRFYIVGSTTTWSADTKFEFGSNGILEFSGWSDFKGIHTFLGDFTTTDGRVTLEQHTTTSVTGTMRLAQLDFSTGYLVDTTAIVEDIMCSSHGSSGVPFATLQGGSMSITGTTSKTDGCYILLHDSSTFTVEEGAVLTSTEGPLPMGFASFEAENAGTFINKGRIVMKPFTPSRGPHFWNDVSVDHQGVFECQTSTLYLHCMQLTQYRGSDSASVSTGQFIINSEANEYTFDFDDGWAPLEFSGFWEFKNGHSISGGSVTSHYGAEGLDCSPDPECARQTEQYFLPAGDEFTFDILNIQARIRMYSEADLVINKCLWDAGFWGGEGDVTIKEEMTISDSGLGAGAEKFLVGKRIIIENRLIVTTGAITGLSGAVIEIQEDAELDWYYGSSGFAITWISVDDSDMTLLNKGTINMHFDDFYSLNAGDLRLVNRGLIQFVDSDEYYGLEGATPQYYVSGDYRSEFKLRSEGTLVVRIRATPNDYDEDYKFNDVFELFSAAVCQLGGKLIVEFKQPVGANCFPTCEEFVPAAGDQWNIINHRSGEDINDETEPRHPCYGSFDEVEFVGLPEGVQAGINYNYKSESTTIDAGSVIVIICAEADEECGGGPNQFSEDPRGEGFDGEPTGDDDDDDNSTNDDDDTDTEGTEGHSTALYLSFVTLLFIFN